MEFRQFRYAFRVAQTKHFGRAAELEHITPSVLSVQIKRLETSLGMKLFDRTPQGVELTAAGEYFIREAQALFKSLEQLQQDSVAIARSQHVKLNIGFFGEAAGELTHLIFGSFSAAYPNVSLQFTELTMSTQFEALVSGSVDLALMRLPVDDESFTITELFEEPRYAAVSRNSELSDAEELSIADLIDHPFAIAGEGTPAAWSSYWSLDDQRGARSPVAATVHTLPESLSAIAYSDAVDTYPGSGARSFSHPGVAFVPLSDANPSVLGIVSKRENSNPMVDKFSAVARLIVSQHIGVLGGARSLVDPSP